jgi:hypothetical protein
MCVGHPYEQNTGGTPVPHLWLLVALPKRRLWSLWLASVVANIIQIPPKS